MNRTGPAYDKQQWRACVKRN